uniref:Protein alan shepard n=1 Tax=Parascaris univalens TaxID=6257 RepID=A0A914ZRY0_PARUN
RLDPIYMKAEDGKLDEQSVQTNASTAREPDPDTIKMFVGQIPRSWGEQECRELFEQFGSVYQLNVLRDKTTQASRGCCFVTFYRRADAIAAQAALHNIRVLPQMHHPVQMKPADSENRNVSERKLFVGMLNKRLTEEDVKAMFAHFGHIEDCTVLKDSDGKSRGCAFVTFANRSYAQQAIRLMHHSQTMEGCSTPIVVKFADTQKEKEAKKTVGPSASPTLQGTNNIAASIQQLLQSAQQPCLANTNPALGTQLSVLATLLQGSGQPNMLSILGNANALHQQQQQLIAIQQQQRLLELISQQQLAALPVQQAPTDLSTAYYAASHPGGVPITFATAPTESPGLSTASIVQGTSPTEAKANFLLGNGSSNLIQLTGAAAPASNYDALQHAYAGIHQYAAAFPQLATNGQQVLVNAATPTMSVVTSTTSGGQSKGPDGCNLFIYHLPQDFADSDLVTTFSPFGNILSAKVFIDKQTNLSKCFGFVSYDNAVSAQNAIAALNGFQIGSKRLKVQLKRGKDSKPYVHPGSSAVPTNGTTLSA